MQNDLDRVLQEARLTREDDPERAAELLLKFLEANPGSSIAKLLLASILADGYAEGPPGAEKLYREVLNARPDSVAALCGLAMLHGHPGSRITSEESLSLLSRAAEISKDPEIELNYASKAWDLGLTDLALRIVLRIQANPRLRTQPILRKRVADIVRRIRSGEARPSDLAFSWPEID